MNTIKVSSELGIVTAISNHKLDKKKNFMIKSLAFLQLACMTPKNEEDENFEQFLDIVIKAVSDARALYTLCNEENNESSSIKQF